MATKSSREDKKSLKKYLENKIIQKALMSRGIPVRISAVRVEDDTVHVIFKSNEGEIGFFMSHKTYNSIPTDEVATIEDYMKFGELIPAPNEFQY